jgi:hypothetical protein
VPTMAARSLVADLRILYEVSSSSEYLIECEYCVDFEVLIEPTRQVLHHLHHHLRHRPSPRLRHHHRRRNSRKDRYSKSLYRYRNMYNILDHT